MASSGLINFVLLAAFGFAIALCNPITTSKSTASPSNLLNGWYFPGNNVGWGSYPGWGNNIGWGSNLGWGNNNFGYGYPGVFGYPYGGYGLGSGYLWNTAMKEKGTN